MKEDERRRHDRKPRPYEVGSASGTSICTSAEEPFPLHLQIMHIISVRKGTMSVRAGMPST